MLRMQRALFSLPALFTLVASGCDILLGLDNPQPLPPSTTTTTTGTFCDPGSVEECDYSGPDGTKGIGACRAATRTCDDIGSAYGACEGEVLPKPEDCATGADDDCDGVANEADAGCACIPGQTEACYSGPAETLGVGACKSGVRTCNPDGLGLGPCVGEILPVPEDCNVKGDEDCSGLPCSDTLWSSVHGSAKSQQPRDLAIDAQGNILVLGSFYGSLEFGNTTLISSGLDIFLVKFAPNGQALWAKRFGDATFQSAGELAVDKDGNVLITGAFSPTIDIGCGVLSANGISGTHRFVAKLSSTGSCLWSKAIVDSDYMVIQDVAADPEGNVLLTGAIAGSVDFGGATVTSASGTDAFVVKLAGDSGAALWGKPFGAAGLQRGERISTDASSNIVLVGGFSGSISLQKLHTAGPDEYRLFFARLDPMGVPFFSMDASGAVDGVGGFNTPSIAVDAAGNVLFAAAFSESINIGGQALDATGSFDVVLARIDVVGNVTLLKQLGGPSLASADDEMFALVGTDASGNVTLVTRGMGTIDYGGGEVGVEGVPSIFVGKMAANGSHLWSKRFGGIGDSGNCVSDTSTDGFIVFACGENTPELDLGNGPLVGGGDGDLFVAKLAP